MPELTFPHHSYDYPVHQGKHEFVSQDEAIGVKNPQPEDCPQIPAKLREAGVAEVILIHGTFAGNDVLGLMRELARILPGAANSLKRLGKRVFDQLAGDVGNYSKKFAGILSHLINHGYEQPIAINRFLWSGENHHVGRAGGAMTLLDELLQKDWKPNQRILIMAHSHGGNLFALLLNLDSKYPKLDRSILCGHAISLSAPRFGTLKITRVGACKG